MTLKSSFSNFIIAVNAVNARLSRKPHLILIAYVAYIGCLKSESSFCTDWKDCTIPKRKVLRHFVPRRIANELWPFQLTSRQRCVAGQNVKGHFVSESHALAQSAINGCHFSDTRYTPIFYLNIRKTTSCLYTYTLVSFSVLRVRSLCSYLYDKSAHCRAEIVIGQQWAME